MKVVSNSMQYREWTSVGGDKITDTDHLNNGNCNTNYNLVVIIVTSFIPSWCKPLIRDSARKIYTNVALTFCFVPSNAQLESAANTKIYML